MTRRRRASRNWIAGMVVCALVAIIGVAMVAGSAWRAEAARFGGHAAEATADVVYVREYRSNRRNIFRPERYSYRPTVVFVFNDLPASARLDAVNDEAIYREGDTVRIRFDADDPSNAVDVARLGEHSALGGAGVATITVGFAALSALVIIRARSPRRGRVTARPRAR